MFLTFVNNWYFLLTEATTTYTYYYRGRNILRKIHLNSTFDFWPYLGYSTCSVMWAWWHCISKAWALWMFLCEGNNTIRCKFLVNLLNQTPSQMPNKRNCFRNIKVTLTQAPMFTLLNIILIWFVLSFIVVWYYQFENCYNMLLGTIIFNFYSKPT